MGPVEAAVRQHMTAGTKLFTIPDRATFEVAELRSDALMLLFGHSKARTVFRWSFLESIPGFLQGKDWVEIRSVHDTLGVPGSLDGYIKTSGGPKRTSGGYIASVLESAGIVQVKLNRPSAVRLRTNWR